MNASSRAPADPLFIMALPCSFSSLIGAMLGQHPQLYGLPETHLFGCNTIAEWWNASSKESFNMSHGLLRAVAQLYFDEQSDVAVAQAHAWLRRRSDFTTGYLLEMLAERISPRILVEKSPSIVYSSTSMDRAHSMFPLARFIHLVQHPRSYCESVSNAIQAAAQIGQVPTWMLDLASYPGTSNDFVVSGREEHADPQRGWLVLNTNICEFLESIPDPQKIRVRGEDVLNDPAETLRYIADWMKIRSDDEAIEEMKHPERSPYAALGPPSALYGNDHRFLAHPSLTPDWATPQALDGALNWKRGGVVCSNEVKHLARQFGYT